MNLDNVLVAARAASEKSLDETVVLDVGELLGITDYFVITSGRNAPQVRSIVEEVRKQVREAGCPNPRQVEGLSSAHWVLLDYGAFVVHVFDTEARAFYGLERLWSDAERVPLEPVALGAPH
ncbi:MAG: ribosome silencing factor RsfS/YbeB/iojap [Acidimicrobiaceae bacterium]|nr:ribosome silencing factor RsfS/YbeB/iojap [Acidimicrobiaceae bacterium]